MSQFRLQDFSGRVLDIPGRDKDSGPDGARHSEAISEVLSNPTKIVAREGILVVGGVDH